MFMFTKSSWLGALIAICAIAMCTQVAYAQKPEAEDEPAVKLAREIYELMLNQYQAGELSGPMHLELLNKWSQRILMAEFGQRAIADDLVNEDAVQKSIRDHLARMQKLERIVKTRFLSGSASKSDLLAARYFGLERNGIERTVNSMRQPLQRLEHGFDIKMPQDDKSKPLEAKGPSVVIDVDAQGKFSIEGKELTIEQLEKQLQKVARQAPRSASANIRAHPDCLYGKVVEVVSVCTKSGITSVSFTSVKKAKDK